MKSFGGVFDPETLKIKLEELIRESQKPDIWDNQGHAQKILKEKSLIEDKLRNFDELNISFKDSREYYQLAVEEGDQRMMDEIKANLDRIDHQSEELSIKSLFSDENDANNCFIDINAGAGGTDSCDFAIILMRMYERFASRHDFKVEIANMIDGDDAGIRSATLKISGDYAFGWLKSEAGVHRLVRISPFNANGKRQTSFASIWVYPEVDDEINIEIEDKDLRIDTYRASGAGGQHVNKTDSAVRITHLPTNTVASCQSDRSQLRNRAEAMKILKSKLYEIELEKKREIHEKDQMKKTDNSWGNQIRSYVMHPYQMVKDLRSSFEKSDINSVLDGNLDEFIKSNLIKK